MKCCAWITDINGLEPNGFVGLTSDLKSWGLDSLCLASMAKSGLSTIPGFSISSQVFTDIFKNSGLRGTIEKSASLFLGADPKHSASAAEKIRTAIHDQSFKSQITKELDAYYNHLRDLSLRPKGGKLTVRLIALSSESTDWELYLDLTSGESLGKAILQLYSLAFLDHLFLRRLESGQVIIPEPFAVMVQYYNGWQLSGSAYCFDKEKQDDSIITILANHQERPNSQHILHDELRFDSKSLTLLSSYKHSHWWKTDNNGNHVAIPSLKRGTSVLSTEAALLLAKKVKLAQSNFLDPHYFEWVWNGNQFMFSRAYPLPSQFSEITPKCMLEEGQPLPYLIGLPGNHGWAHGPLKKIKRPADLAKVVSSDVVVLEHILATDWSHLLKAAGIIAETGNQHSPEAVLSKRMAVPCVIATGSALSQLKEGQIVTIDGAHGLVYLGKVDRNRINGSFVPEDSCLPITGTKVYASIIDANQTINNNLANFDGICPLRSEHILNLLDLHPHDILRRQLREEYIDILVESIEPFFRSIYPKPIIYQFHDILSAPQQYRILQKHTRQEPNPKMGHRGAGRMLLEPELMDLELEVIGRVSTKGLSNMSVMIPMLRTTEELARLITYINSSPLISNFLPDIWVKCETPAVAMLVDELIHLPIQGICFDVPALTQLMSGLDADNPQIGHTLDYSCQAVSDLLAVSIQSCRNQHVSTAILSESGNLQPETIQACIGAGVSAVCVVPDMDKEMRGLIASIEKKLLLDHALGNNT